MNMTGVCDVVVSGQKEIFAGIPTYKEIRSLVLGHGQSGNLHRISPSKRNVKQTSLF